ncbi:MAG: AraC family transcriptional regulator [Clostridia bacterium]|nr:AraC family transcriptional regulator [Clostridia bacterium]
MENYYEYKDSNLFAHYTCTERPNPESFYMHTHENYELYCFFDGVGTYKIEGNDYPLKPGDILIMRPAEAHYIQLKPNHPYKRFAIHFNPSLFGEVDKFGELTVPFTDRSAGKKNLYRSSDFRNLSYRTYVQSFTEISNNRRLQLVTNLLPLLNEIAYAFETKKDDETDTSLDFKIVSYINSHLTENLSLDSVCSEFHISKPQLCRIFKSATGSTVWDYVTVKRLVYARELLKSGVSATSACTGCGFNDYSVFYRAYKRKYGVSPSDKNI